jgi:hypothetical protein
MSNSASIDGANGLRLANVANDGPALLSHELLEVPGTASEFAGRAGELPAAEWLGLDQGASRRALFPVYVAHPGLDSVEPGVDLVFVLREESGTECVVAIVGLLERLVEVRDGVDRDERKEVLLHREVVIMRNVFDDGWLDVATVGKFRVVYALAAGKNRTVGGSALADPVVALERPIVDDGRDDALAFLRPTDDQLFGLLDQSRGELLNEVLVDVDAGGRRALLSAKGERTELHARDGLRQVGGLGDNHGILPAEFRDDRAPLTLLLEGLLDPQADLPGAGKGEAGDVLVLHHRLTDRPTAASDEVDNAVRDSHLGQHLEELVGHEWGRARGLDDRRVAGNQGASGHPNEDREREVKRRDDADDAVGLQIAGAVLARRRLSGRRRISLVALDIEAIVLKEVDRLVDLRERLRPVFPVLEGHRRGDLVLPVADALGRPAKDLDAFLPIGGRPILVRHVGGCNGIVDGVGVAGGKLTDQPVVVPRVRDGERLRSFHGMAVDPQGVTLTEVSANGLDGVLVCTVDRFEVVVLLVPVYRKFVLKLAV